MIRIVAAWLILGAGILAYPAATSAADAQPKDARATLELAEWATLAGRFVQADAMLDLLETEGSTEIADSVTIARAELQMATGDVAGATMALRNGSGEAGGICRRSKLLGWIAGKNQEWNKAILMLSQAVEKCGGDASLWNILGLALAGKREHAASLEAFDSALILQPGNPALLSNRALALVGAGQYEAALFDLREAIAAKPDSAIIQNNIDYLSGVLGIGLKRMAGDSDTLWAGRLAKAGEGARDAARPQEAQALFAGAALLQDRFDPRIWSLGLPTENRKAE